MGSLGWQELLLILLAMLLLFGAKRLPEIGRSLGRGMREFKRSVSGIAEEAEKTGEEESDSDRKAG
jgi:sec-independent protein translocase protein TatA